MKKVIMLLTTMVLTAMMLTPVITLGAETWETKVIPTDVEAGVICVLDGCNMNLSTCENAAAEKLRGIIRQKMFKEGLSNEETYAYLVSVYGDQVLAAPPKKGFNWVAWLGPFVATIGGGAVIYLGLEKWVSSRWHETEEEDAIPLDPEEARRLEEELKKYL